MRGRDSFNKYRGLLLLLSKTIGLFPRQFRLFLFETTRNLPGKIGLATRYVLLKTVAKAVGDNVAVFPMVVLKNVSNLEIGSNVSIHPYSYIDAMGGVVIGDDVSFGHGLSILSFEHCFSKIDVPIKDQGSIMKPVRIDSNVYTGAKVTILGNVTIGSGTVVGANACVTKSFEGNVVLGGVPAKVLKRR